MISQTCRQLTPYNASGFLVEASSICSALLSDRLEPSSEQSKKSGSECKDRPVSEYIRLSVIDGLVFLVFQNLKSHPGVPTNLRTCLQSALRIYDSMSFFILTGMYLSVKFVKIVFEMDVVVFK